MPATYEEIILTVFFDHYKNGDVEVRFTRDDVIDSAKKLSLPRPKNVGDLVYSYRYRKPLPQRIQEVAPEGTEWCIRGKGDAEYAFVTTRLSSRITPNENLLITKIPDATPEIIRSAAGNDEQALLAIVRYNRLIDTFIGVTAYSLQNHLRTNVKGIGQVEVDELYIAVNSYGQQFIIPVEAKGHNDQIGRVQTEQDLAVCRSKWGKYNPIAIAVQFMSDSVVAMFELIMLDDDVRVVKEKHYELVQAADITDADRDAYNTAADTGDRN